MASTNNSILHAHVIWIGFLLFIGSQQLCLCFNGNSSKSGSCIEMERKALLSIREGIYDAHKWLSWNGKDCCKWRGVQCDTMTDHVVKLDLHYPYPYDPEYYFGSKNELSPSLLDLRHLNYLDLSKNNFGRAPIPRFIGSLAKLEYLNLSYARFDGTIPHQLGNLSSLVYLDLYSVYSSLHVDDLGWLSQIHLLQHLDMSHVNLSKASNWFHVINMLPSLSVLRLSGASLLRLPSILFHVNFTSLTALDLSENNFASSIPGWLFNLSSLEHLDLGANFFHGSISLAIGNLKKLQVLDLSQNSFNGDIPEIVYSLKSMQSIDISYNNISGSISETVGNLKSLESLDFSTNSISGDIPKTIWSPPKLRYLNLRSNNISGVLPRTIGNLTCLQYFSVSSNKIKGTIPESIENLHNLQVLDLSSNQISGKIPGTIGNLHELDQLWLSNNAISGQIPETVGNLHNLERLHLDHNSLSGPLPNQIGELQSLQDIDVSVNSLAGVLTEAHFANLACLFILDMSHNSLTVNVSQGWHPLFTAWTIIMSSCLLGPKFPPWLRNQVDLSILDLSSTKISDSFPDWLCEANSLQILNLADNDLMGVLPDCWDSFNLMVIDFSYNKLSGGIPSSMGSLSQLESLHLENNGLSHEIPLSLKNCTQLVTMDLGNNELSSSIPQWIGESLSSLKVLRLRSNTFDGDIPMQLSLLASLQVLDLADNNLSGSLPPSLGNLSAMTVIQKGSKSFLPQVPYYTENLLISTKDLELTFTSVLSLMIGIDLSDNNISGEIPKEFANLHGLCFLNLSGNYLTGRIPNNIGALGQLESLDLSMNNLSGTIPTSIAALDFLSYLNLSHNNLSGRIPFGNQLQTLTDPSIYSGNKYLCGQPIGKCPGDEPAEGPTIHGGEESEENPNDSEMIWGYVSFAPGFVVGFWGFLGAMMIKRSTRFAYIQFIDKICDWIYMAVALVFARPKSKRNQRRM